MMNKTNPPQRPKRAQRSDGRSTRAVVLEAAGKVFAERGFAEATSKEICERAGTNGAAVNYYFGGKEGLYEEVLIEAHRQMLSLEDLNRIITSEATPEEKLRVFLKHIIRTAMNASELWGSGYSRANWLALALRAQIHHNGGIPEIPETPGTDTDITGLPPDSRRCNGQPPCRPPCMGLILFRKATHPHASATAGDAGVCLKTCWRICWRPSRLGGNGPVGI
ncbi:MAG: TetR/AcrR family transcriptional regulator [Bilophila wadsworthia]